MSKLKLGVVGCGGIANQKHFPALKNNADLNEIVAFCDIKVERAEKMVEAWKKSGKQFTVGYQNRFRGEVQNLHAACEKGELGDIDWDKYVSALTDIGYKGYSVIEVEDKAFEGSAEDVKNSVILSAKYLRNFVI